MTPYNTIATDGSDSHCPPDPGTAYALVWSDF